MKLTSLDLSKTPSCNFIYLFVCLFLGDFFLGGVAKASDIIQIHNTVRSLILMLSGSLLVCVQCLEM